MEEDDIEEDDAEEDDVDKDPRDRLIKVLNEIIANQKEQIKWSKKRIQLQDDFLKKKNDLTKLVEEKTVEQDKVIKNYEQSKDKYQEEKAFEHKRNQIAEQKILLRNQAFAGLIKTLETVPVFTANPDYLPKLKNLMIGEPINGNHDRDITDSDLADINREKIVTPCWEQVLKNHVILQEVFKYLERQEHQETHLFNARLVCKAWNSAALSQTPPQFTFNVRKYLKECPTQDIFSLEQKLLRRIIFSAKSYYNDEDESNVINLLKEFGTSVQDIELCYDSELLIHTISFLMENNLCPNLKRIEGSLICRSLQTDKEYVFSAMKNLKTIDIEYISGTDKSVVKLELLEDLIKNAPNLEELTLAEKELEQFKISLSSHYLKKLKIVFKETSSLKNMIIFLRSYSSNLELLSINAWYKLDFTEHPEVPKMPKLVKFELIDHKGMDFQELFNCFKPEVIPNLKELSISRSAATAIHYDYNRNRNNSTFLGLIQHRYENLVKLKLNVFNPKILENLINYCPSLQDLTVLLTIPTNISETSDDSDSDGDEIEDSSSDKFKEDLLEQLLHYVKHLPLKNFSLEIAFKYDLSVLIVALGKHYFQLFSGLKTLWIQNTNDGNQVFDSLPGAALLPKIPKLDLLSTFCDILLAIGEIEGLDVYMHNFQFNAITSQRIMKIVDKLKIPVHFTCGAPHRFFAETY